MTFQNRSSVLWKAKEIGWHAGDVVWYQLAVWAEMDCLVGLAAAGRVDIM